MKRHGLHYLLAFISLIVAAGLACQALTSTPTAAPAPTIAPAPTQPPSNEPPTAAPADSSNSGGVQTFTDKNNFFAIDLPAAWTHTTGTDTNMYWDRFSAPDQHAFIENIAYDDGTPWTGGSNGKGALYLLNSVYSNTGKEGDIRVSDDKIQSDGSERLTWASKSGGYSGVSFFEVRNKTTFLMLTAWWGNDYENTYRDVLDKVIGSYRVP